MPDDPKVKGFPDISAKLSAPQKKSLFERQKAEAEAKRAREQAETAAVYEDFVKSFDEDPTKSTRSSGSRSSGYGQRSAAALGSSGPAARRHFTNSAQRNSGPGTLGPAPPPHPRKRTYDGFSAHGRPRDSTSGILSFDSPASAPLGPASAFRTSDDEEEDRGVAAKEAERAAAKPTLYLSSLPPTISATAIKSLIPSSLGVDNVKVLRVSSQNPKDRKSIAALVTLASETAASEIDSAVSLLQNRYLGWGYYLSISRHLSSAAVSSALPVTTGLPSTSSNPFGAKPVPQASYGRKSARAPPPGLHRGGYAPPKSYASQSGRGGHGMQVDVSTPSDLKQLKLIHKTLENLLNYGPEFEALLMSRPEIQKDERWAWLWDPRSAGGVYYRWKLWDVLTNSGPRRRQQFRNPSLIFEGGAQWLAPEAATKFEYTMHIDEFVSDDDYNSSDEEGLDMDDERRAHHGAPSNDPLAANSDGHGYLDPLQKAKLTHLLARLPTTNTKLRRGDVARVTAFAIEHAGAGADEVVQMIISNIVRPFAYSGANPNHEQEKKSVNPENAEEQSRADDSAQDARGHLTKDKLDTSAAKLVGLYIISDILSSSATSGVRHAWRYRQLFESALRSSRVFEHLGRLEKELGWGRLKAEKWKRSIGTLLHLWEGWCVFPQSSHDHFVQVFEKPPPTEGELSEEKAKADSERAADTFVKGKDRWMAVDEDPEAGKFDPMRATNLDSDKMDVDHAHVHSQWIENTDDYSMSDIDGIPMEDSDLDDADGQPMEEDSEFAAEDGDQNAPKLQAESKETCVPNEPSGPRSSASARKPRPKAEDMFANSDSE